MDVGNYTALISYAGNNKQESTNTTANIKVLSKIASIINVDDVEVYYGETAVLNVTLTDADGNALADEEIIALINGVNYTAKTNNDGIASFKVDLEIGNYTAFISYTGNYKQESANNTANIQVLYNKTTIVDVNDLEMYYKEGSVLNVSLTNAYGDVLANEKITVTVDANNYTATTNDKGIATFELDLEIGNYTAVVSYAGSDKQDSANTTAIVTVLYNSTTIISADDVEMYYMDGTLFKVSLTNAYGDVLANEKVTLTVDGLKYIVTTNSKGIVSFDLDLEVGNYTALVSYAGNSKQDSVNTTAKIIVLYNSTSIISVDDVEMYYNDGSVLNVSLNNIYGDVLANEKITVSVDANKYTATTNDKGIASFDLDLEVGNYTAIVSYAGSDKQDAANTTAKITILPDTTTIISVDDLVMYYKDGSRLYINLTDSMCTPLVNESVIISLNGANYTRATNENGTASIAINLNSANYTVNIYYNGSETQSPANATASITILPTVNGTDVVKVFRNGTQYYATFLDNKGNYLAEGTNVTFNINGVTYTRQINGSEGRARLNINLAQGDYIITAINPVTGEMAANNITVIPRIINNNDLVKYYKNDSQYYVQLIGEDGKAVGANETVTFNINGVMYERKTNESGIARLNINLQPGEYVITAMYNDCNVANNITVLPVLKAENITMVYKDGTQFKANLVDGQGKPLANTNVTFNINGVFYQRTTDSNGVAALNINLMPGEYIITSSYNGTNIANTIKINDK